MPAPTENPNTLDKHKHIRDEKFWFTAAAVGFNTLFMRNDISAASTGHVALPAWFLIMASAVISLFACHLILTRWLESSGRFPARHFDNTTATAFQRAKYNGAVIWAYLKDIGYVIAEFSGTLFYLALIVLTAIGVALRLKG